MIDRKDLELLGTLLTYAVLILLGALVAGLAVRIFLFAGGF